MENSFAYQNMKAITESIQAPLRRCNGHCRRSDSKNKYCWERRRWQRWFCRGAEHVCTGRKNPPQVESHIHRGHWRHRKPERNGRKRLHLAWICIYCWMWWCWERRVRAAGCLRRFHSKTYFQRKTYEELSVCAEISRWFL